jgi:hypothetical protein
MIDAEHLAADSLLIAPRREAKRPSVPTFDGKNLYGVVGEWVNLWAQHTEAAPVAIYATALATSGALIGRGPHALFGNTTHHARLFPVLIGPSGSGRKGTALAIGASVFLSHVDPDFRRLRYMSGLSSAEGLIAEIRDPSPSKLDAKTGKVLVASDDGVIDKRLLVVEGEYGGALEAMSREGNRLSAVLRDAWDGATLRSMVKRDPQSATDPHVVILGAITSHEFRRLLKDASLSNGFANRLLPIYCERAQLLAEDSQPADHEVARVANVIADRITAARHFSGAHWTPEAALQWRIEYSRLAVVDDPSSIIRGLLERGAPYVRRMALLFALLDGTCEIDVRHLRAALALWRYVADTWRHLYADGVTRSALAQKLLVALDTAGKEGLTRTMIREKVVRSNSLAASVIQAALAELSDAGLAICSMNQGDGRPTEHWHHARHVGAEHPTGEKGAKGDMKIDEGPEKTLAPFGPLPPTAGSAHAAVPPTHIGPAFDQLDERYWESLTLDPAA